MIRQYSCCSLFLDLISRVPVVNHLAEKRFVPRAQTVCDLCQKDMNRFVFRNKLSRLVHCFYVLEELQCCGLEQKTAGAYRRKRLSLSFLGLGQHCRVEQSCACQ